MSQYRHIAMCFPPARGNLRLSNLEVQNAILYVLENGLNWRALPKIYGSCHTIYTRMHRWAKSGVLDRAFEKHREENILNLPEGTLSLDSTSINVHPD
jgi:transposase